MPLHRRTTDSVRSPQWNAAIFAPPVSSPPTWFVPTFAISTHGASCRSVVDDIQSEQPTPASTIDDCRAPHPAVSWVRFRYGTYRSTAHHLLLGRLSAATPLHSLLSDLSCCIVAASSTQPSGIQQSTCTPSRGWCPGQWPGQKPTAFLFPLSQEVSTFCCTGYRLRHAGFSHIEHPTRRAKISGQRSTERIEEQAVR
jgi:hypothetical protein